MIVQLKKGFTMMLTIAVLMTCMGTFNGTIANASGDVIQFPDDNLKRALLDNGVDLNKDGQITKEEMAKRADPQRLGNGLDNLHLNGYGITNLSGIEHAVNVTNIGLNKNPISDLSPLRSLVNLEGLSFGNSQVSDLSPIANLRNLRVLDFEHSLVKNLSPLATMSSLSVLLIGNNEISDISALAKLENLYVLYASNNNLRDIRALSSILDLGHVNLSNNQITDISPLANAVSMEQLFLNINQISNVEALSGMTNLKVLDLDDNQISDITALANLNSLNRLNLDYNNLSTISPLSGLNKLEFLGLAGNKISDISPINGLTKLVTLYLGTNQIVNIDALSNLTSLVYLYLSSNQISDIKALAGMTRMESLMITDNVISDISPLQGLTGMTELRISNNKITDVSPLTSMSKLRTLLITGNQIKDASPLKLLTNLKNLIIEEHLKAAMGLPVSGIVRGGHYNTDVTITFDTGTGKLNEVPITSGTVVSAEGNYDFFLSGAGVVTKTPFVIDKTAPKITGVTDGGIYREGVEIIFNEGSATLNGKPAHTDFWVNQQDGSNNNRVRAEEYGQYKLVVTDLAGNSTTTSFIIQAADMILRGVSNKGVYNSERTITFTDATALLNGSAIQSGDKVSEAGEYTLELRGTNGRNKVIHFTIKVEEIGTSFNGVSKWATEDIAYAQRIGLTDPVTQLNFTSYITREKFSEIAVKLYEALTNTKTNPFDNNPFTDTNNEEIVKAYHLGIVSGTSENTFSPNARITREQLSAMLLRVLNQAKVSLPSGSKKTFKDRQQFSSYAVEAIDYLSSIEAIKGIDEHNFGPKKYASIEQALVMVKRIYMIALESGTVDENENSSGNGGTTGGGEPSDNNAIFGTGDMFTVYVSDVVAYIGVEGLTNIYSLKNESAFVLPAYSAIYITSMINQTPTDNETNGKLLISNMTDQPKRISAKGVDISLRDIYRDKWGTTQSPDGKTVDMKSTGPFIRLVVFDGPFDDQKEYSSYVVNNQVADLGNWYKVRHTK